jgi:K+-sensing histidine kinase KdpD
MFAPFQRLDDRTTNNGLGLGLAIARGFSEAMHGTVTHILVIDDDAQLLRALWISQSARGYNVTVARNGVPAVQPVLPRR